MIALILDVETTGKDPLRDEIIEVAGLTWSTAHRAAGNSFSVLVKRPTNGAVTVNGITPELAMQHGLEPGVAIDMVGRWMEKSDVVVAHNADFDKSFFPDGIQRRRPWLCTQDDFDWPCPSPKNGLIDILLAHGLGVSHAHRAHVDAENIARLFEACVRMGHDIEKMFERAMRPKRRYRAKVSFGNNELAKAAGFRWVPERKSWVRKIADEDVAAAREKYTFEIEEMLG